MLRIMGCLLVIIGSIGFAQSICREGKNRLEMLKQMRGIFETMKYYMVRNSNTETLCQRKHSD